MGLPARGLPASGCHGQASAADCAGCSDAGICEKRVRLYVDRHIFHFHFRQMVQAQPVQHVQQLQIRQVGPIQLQPVQDVQQIQVRMPMIRQPPVQAMMYTYDPPPRHYEGSHNQPIEVRIPHLVSDQLLAGL